MPIRVAVTGQMHPELPNTIEVLGKKSTISFKNMFKTMLI